MEWQAFRIRIIIQKQPVFPLMLSFAYVGHLEASVLTGGCFITTSMFLVSCFTPCTCTQLFSLILANYTSSQVQWKHLCKVHWTCYVWQLCCSSVLLIFKTIWMEVLDIKASPNNQKSTRSQRKSFKQTNRKVSPNTRISFSNKLLNFQKDRE